MGWLPHVRRLAARLAMLLYEAGVLATAQTTGLPPELLTEIQAPARLPQGRYAVVQTWEAEAAGFGHRVGQAIADPAAGGGACWEARAAPDDGLGPLAPDAATASPGYLVYGPYQVLPPGDYVALFRLYLQETDVADEVAALDACTDYGKTVLAARAVTSPDLSPERYAQVPLPFHYEAGKLECRLWWTATATLRLDRVILCRVEGADPKAFLGRVDQPEPSGQPTGLALDAPSRPFPELFPRSAPPAAELLVADLQALPPDWRLCLVSLQGLVNRTEPRLYCLSHPTDQQWLDWMLKRGWVKAATPAPRADELVRRFAEAYRGAVIPDPAIPASKNVATMLAGVRGGLVASPRIARRLDLPVLEDLRGRWPTSVEAYRWAFETLWPELNHGIAACLWPESHGLRDYLVQHRVPVFWLPGRIDGARSWARPAEEVRLVEEMLSRLPANVPVLGYPWAGKDVGLGEGPGVTLFAEFGKFLVGSIDCSNLSVHSGIRPGELRQKPAPPLPELDLRKAYVSLLVSDGDNLPVLTAHNFPQLWKEPLRGQFPIGWTLSPAAVALLPDVVDFYYGTATAADSFMAAVSGVGYTYPDAYGKRYRSQDQKAVFDGFLELTRASMRAADLRQAWIMNATRPELIRRYADAIPEVDAIFPDYGRRVGTYDDATYPTARGVPVFHAVSGWIEGAPRDEQVGHVVAQVRHITPVERPAFLHVFIWNWGFDLGMLDAVLGGLGPDYAAVRPDHLAALCRGYLREEAVLLRFPRRVVGIEGTSLGVDGHVHNTRETAQTLRLTADGQGRTEPAEFALAPGAAQAVTLTVAAGRESVCLSCSGGGWRRSVTIACESIPRGELIEALPDGRALRFVHLLEAEDLSHRSGQAVAEPTAGGGAVWSARPGTTDPGHIVFGPYLPMPPGEYLALFRVRRGGDARAGRVLTVDACRAGPVTVDAERVLSADELPADRTVWVPLRFSHPGGLLETRVHWAGNGSVAVDRIGVWDVRPPDAGP